MKKEQQLIEVIRDWLYINRRRIILWTKRGMNTKGQYASRLLLLLTFVLFFLILIPTLFNRLPFYDLLIQNGVLPYHLTLKGNVSVEEEFDDKNAYGAEVRIGGFSTETDINGLFELYFIADNKKKIPIAIYYKGKDYFYYVSFPDDGDNYTKEYVLHDR